MSDDSFDEIDRLLAGGLAELAPEVEGGDEALAALRPRFQRARTRARVAKIGGAVALLLLVGSVATLVAPSSRRTHVQVSAPPTSAEVQRPKSTSTTTAIPTTTLPKPTSTSLPVGSSSPTTVRSKTSGAGVAPTTPRTIPGTVPQTNAPDDHGGSGSGGSGGSSGPSHGGSAPGTTIPPTHTNVTTYHSPGGSIRVRFAYGRLQLISVSPAPGYHSRVERKRSDYIDVRFSNSHGEWRVRVRIEKGRPVPDIDHY